MSQQQVFDLLNGAPLIGWLALVLAPARRPLLIAVARVVATALCVAYALMLGAALLHPTSGAKVDFTHLAALARAFSNPGVMLVGWTHYLAFDLWVGSWEAEEAHRRGVPHWALIPCLVLTFLAGPAGLLLFLFARGVFRKRVTL